MKQNVRFQGGICPQKSNLSNSKCPILLAFIDFNMPDIWQTVQIARPLLWKNVRVREGCTLKKLYHAGVAEVAGWSLVPMAGAHCQMENHRRLLKGRLWVTYITEYRDYVTFTFGLIIFATTSPSWLNLVVAYIEMVYQVVEGNNLSRHVYLLLTYGLIPQYTAINPCPAMPGYIRG